MRLFVQIPCLNERECLDQTFRDIPRRIPGVTSIEVLVVDDGSTDGTAELARTIGVHHIVRFSRNRGLAAAYSAGLDACYRLGADVVVNFDADNQYPGSAIEELVRPIIEGRAEIVVGDRQTDRIAHFSPIKKALQRLGTRVVRAVSQTGVTDSTSGFRALSRKALARTYVHNRFTYTLETLIQAGQAGLVVDNVLIRTNEKRRESRLFRSIPEYVRRNGAVILRAFHMYWPTRTFGWIAAGLLGLGLTLGGRFLFYYFVIPGQTGHVQSLLVAVGALVLSMVAGTMIMMSELVATNRRLIEDLLVRSRGIERALAASAPTRALLCEDVLTTGASAWTQAESVPPLIGSPEPDRQEELEPGLRALSDRPARRRG